MGFSVFKGKFNGSAMGYYMGCYRKDCCMDLGIIIRYCLKVLCGFQ